MPAAWIGGARDGLLHYSFYTHVLYMESDTCCSAYAVCEMSLQASASMGNLLLQGHLSSRIHLIKHHMHSRKTVLGLRQWTQFCFKDVLNREGPSAVSLSNV